MQKDFYYQLIDIIFPKNDKDELNELLIPCKQKLIRKEV